MDLPLFFLAVIVWYGIWSAVAFIAYALDKSAARHGRRRISENTLHVLALLGGWPGAWLASRLLHHKSRKAAFRRVFWGTVLGNVFLSGMVWISVRGA